MQKKYSMQSILASACLSILVSIASGLPIAQAAGRGPQAAEVAAKTLAGNRALKAGNVQDALNAYREAATIDPDNDAAVYNQAVALYRAGQLAEAAELFRRTAASENATIAANARFNLGNTAYAQSLESLEQDPVRAAEDLRRAIDSYREGLALNPTDEDARANLELAGRLLQQLQTQQQMPKDSGEDSPRPSQTEASADSEEENPPESDDSNDKEPPEQSPPEDSKSASGSNQQPDQAPQDGSDSQPADATRSMETPPDRQPAAEGDPQEASETGESDQPLPDDSSEEQDSSGQLAAANEEEGEERERAAGQAALNDSANMTYEEAQKMLQAIRDRDMLRRFRRQQIERSRRIPVEKDW